MKNLTSICLLVIFTGLTFSGLTAIADNEEAIPPATPQVKVKPGTGTAENETLTPSQPTTLPPTGTEAARKEPVKAEAATAESITVKPPKVKPGIEVLLEKQLQMLQGKKVGLITNPTGVDSNLKSTVDLLMNNPEVNLVALFGPEHGIRGDQPAGEYVKSYTDKKTGLPVFSLHGKTRKPVPDMLEGIDVLLFDIQDVGARYYTYIYTMALSMEAAKEKGIEFIVLDRPNPLGGINIGGPVMESKFKSFIGMYPIPVVHGMTVGELAKLFNEEFGIGANLTVVKMEGWERGMFFEDTGLPWINTSPHIPTPLTTLLYPVTGFIGELKSVSTGIGTTRPFEYIGAPWIEGETLAGELNKLKLPGVYFRPVCYQPFYALHKNKECHGVQIHVIVPEKFKPVETGIHIIGIIKKLYPERISFSQKNEIFNKTLGTEKVCLLMAMDIPPEEIIASWQEELKKFADIRSKYLIYSILRPVLQSNNTTQHESNAAAPVLRSTIKDEKNGL